jgi:gamma-glutamyltranspeptidase/glutathione hydrolase
MYLDTEGNVIEGKSTASSVAPIPGTLAGLFQVHKNTVLCIAEILAPVIALAENGVVVTEFQHKAANYRETFIKLMVPTACFLKYTRQVIRLSIRH